MKVRLPSRYRFLRRLGQGAMGSVLLVHDRTLDRDVALKLIRGRLLSSPDVLARFFREARLMARVTHPNLARIFDCHEDPEAPFMTMEFVPGENLSSWLEQRGPQPLALVRSWAHQLGGAVDALHAGGAMHRDLKPSNVMVREGGQDLVLMDLGLSDELEGENLTVSGAIVGTPQYLPPEVLTGQGWCPGGDIFQLAAVLFEALTGSSLIPGGDMAAVLRAASSGAHRPFPPELTSVPGSVRAALARGAASDPERRFASGVELAEALAAEEGDAKPAGRAPENPTSSRARTLRVAVLDTRDQAAPVSHRVAWIPLVGGLLLGGLLGRMSAPLPSPAPAPRASEPPPPLPSPRPLPTPPPPPAPPRLTGGPLPGHREAVTGLALAPGVSASVSGDELLLLHQARAPGAPRWLADPGAGFTGALAFDVAGSRLLTGGFAGRVRSFRVEDGAEGPEVSRHQGLCRALLVHPGSQEVISGGDDGAVLATGLEGATRRLGQGTSPVLALALAGDELLVVARGTGRVELLDLRSEGATRVLTESSPGIRALAGWPGRGRVVVVRQDLTRVWELDSGTLRFELDSGGPAALHPGGSWLAAVSPAGDRVQLLETARGRRVHQLEAPPGGVRSLAFTPDGELLGVGAGDGGLRLHPVGDTLRSSAPSLGAPLDR